MQQQLQQLANLATLAGEKGLQKTEQQLTALRRQLELLGSANIHPFLITLISKSIAGLQNKLLNGADLTDVALMQECQQQAQALFQAYSLLNEAAKQFQQLDENNERARTNQKYLDQNKNQAREQFNAYLQQLQAQAELTAEDLRAFNQRLREMLERDFRPNNLPKEAAQPVQPESMKQAPAIENFMSTMSNMMNTVNNNDQEGMKNAAASFVGFLIDMVVEAIATLCRTIAPSIAPMISQMAQFAKGAIGHLFNSGMQTAASAQAAASASASTTAAPTTTTSKTAQTPSTTVPSSATPATAATANMSSGLLNAMQQFMQRNNGSKPSDTRATPTQQQQREAAKPVKKPGLLGSLMNNAFNHFKQKQKPVGLPHRQPAPTGHPTAGPMPRKPRNQQS